MRAYLLSQAEKAGFPLNEKQADDLAVYHAMLCEANRQFNLTRVPDTKEEAADRNYLDCVLPLKLVGDDVKTAIDVGSGAGFPGIPMAIVRRDIRFTLIDALGKRVDFLNAVIKELRLNAEAVHIRAEDAARKKELRESFDLAAARAVAGMNVLSEYLLPFVRVGGRMLALKGPNLEEEMAEAEYAVKLLGGQTEAVTEILIPGRDWSHKVISVLKVAPTPERFPRKSGKAEKAPLKG